MPRDSRWEAKSFMQRRKGKCWDISAALWSFPPFLILLYPIQTKQEGLISVKTLVRQPTPYQSNRFFLWNEGTKAVFGTDNSTEGGGVESEKWATPPPPPPRAKALIDVNEIFGAAFFLHFTELCHPKTSKIRDRSLGCGHPTSTGSLKLSSTLQSIILIQKWRKNCTLGFTRVSCTRTCAHGYAYLVHEFPFISVQRPS